jgi:ABC-type Zn uptake system ZnuABC Zn-binding protein ZnuA
MQMFLLLAVSLLGLTFFTGCGNVSGNSGSGNSGSGTQPVTTTITVNASSGSLLNSANLTLTVN